MEPKEFTEFAVYAYPYDSVLGITYIHEEFEADPGLRFSSSEDAVHWIDTHADFCFQYEVREM